MKASEIVIGGKYLAKVNNKVQTVRVDAIRKELLTRGKVAQRYDVTNLATGRTTCFRSSTKFRGVAPSDVKPPTKTEEGLKSFAERFPSIARAAEQEANLPPTAPHLIIEARAGVGKTTVIIEGIKYCRGLPTLITPSPQQQAIWDAMKGDGYGLHGTVCITSYSRHIAKELGDRVPPGCQTMSTYGLGCRIIRKNVNLRGDKGGVNEDRVLDILTGFMGVADHVTLWRKHADTVRVTRRLVELCKLNLYTGQEDQLRDLIERHGIDVEDADYIRTMELVPQVLDRCKQVDRDQCIDYTDMIWLPVVLKMPRSTVYDTLIVDEFQDTSKCQQELIRKCGRRLILVGDKHQSIFSFMGAEEDGIEKMQYSLEHRTCERCIKLPLTITRRCAKRIVEEAQKIVPDIEAHEGNPEGVVRYAEMNSNGRGDYYRIQVRDGDMILCRVNSVLVRECLKLTKAGRRATILGKGDVVTGLVKLVKKLCKPNSPDKVPVQLLLDELGKWLNEEQTQENRKDKPSAAKLLYLKDKHDCIRNFATDAKTGQEVIDKIGETFAEDAGEGIILSTIHGAKGKEARRVFLLEPEGARLPEYWDKTQKQVDEAMRLRYVAVTRSQEELIYVS